MLEVQIDLLWTVDCRLLTKMVRFSNHYFSITGKEADNHSIQFEIDLAFLRIQKENPKLN